MQLLEIYRLTAQAYLDMKKFYAMYSGEKIYDAVLYAKALQSLYYIMLIDIINSTKESERNTRSK